MLTAHDVARYFLSKVEEEAGDGISNLKLQKLVYYAQGCYLGLYNEPLFVDRIEAWEHGPVVASLYHTYKAHGASPIPPEDIDLAGYTDREREMMDEVYDVYGQFSAWKLRNMTHAERPWKEAFDHAVNRVISTESMRDYFKDFVSED